VNSNPPAKRVNGHLDTVRKSIHIEPAIVSVSTLELEYDEIRGQV
jgi:hypothetical protein